MTISEKEFKELQKDVRDIKRQLAGKRRKKATRPKATKQLANRTPKDGRLADEILRQAGLLSAPTVEEKQLVAEWHALPSAERRRLAEEIRSLRTDKQLSQIVIENRR